MERLNWVEDKPMGKEGVLMATRKEAITSLLGTLKIRPNMISVAAAVAMLLIVMLASFGAASAEEIRFTGFVTGINPPEQVGALWWNVTVEELIEGPQTSCDTLKVELILSPPVGSYESDIGVGARVEVYGNYTSDCTVSLNNESYYIVVAAEEIRFTGIVMGINPPEQVGALWWNVSVEEIFSGPQTSCDTLKVELILSPPVGSYESDIGVGARVEVYGNYTSDCTVSLNNESYYIVSPGEIRFTGIVTGKNPPGHCGALWWNVTVEELIEGPQTSCDVLKVRLVIVPPMGYYESDIGIGARVEVYGNYTSDCTVSLNNESYYIVAPGEIRFTGIVTGKNPPGHCGALWWNVSVEEIFSGPQTSCDVLKVRLVIVPPMGYYESDIGIGDRVEVYGNYTSDCTVSLNGVNYSINRIVYPSIPGIHNGTITPFYDLTVSKLYTYPCPGTGGHTEYVRIWNNTDWHVTATWVGYSGDWHSISFNNSFTLYANETYNYTIQTGSYPQIHYTAELLTAQERITCTSFVDVNGKRQENWIPAIRLE